MPPSSIIPPECKRHSMHKFRKNSFQFLLVGIYALLGTGNFLSDTIRAEEPFARPTYPARQPVLPDLPAPDMSTTSVQGHDGIGDEIFIRDTRPARQAILPVIPAPGTPIRPVIQGGTAASQSYSDVWSRDTSRLAPPSALPAPATVSQIAEVPGNSGVEGYGEAPMSSQQADIFLRPEPSLLGQTTQSPGHAGYQDPYASGMSDRQAILPTLPVPGSISQPSNGYADSALPWGDFGENVIHVIGDSELPASPPLLPQAEPVSPVWVRQPSMNTIYAEESPLLSVDPVPFATLAISDDYQRQPLFIAMSTNRLPRNDLESELSTFLEGSSALSAASAAPMDLIPSQVVISRAKTATEAFSFNSVTLRRRSQLMQEPTVRGYQGAQIYSTADGQRWIPIRPDLDSALSKLPPGVLGSTQVIAGPYGARYGAGFAFVDIGIAPIGRSDQQESKLDFDSNVYGNGSVWGASLNYVQRGPQGGMRIVSSYREGDDYRDGAGNFIPASFSASNFLADFSLDLNDEFTLEGMYLFADQGKTDYPGQFYDINGMSTHSVSTTLAKETDRDSWTAQTWLNYSDFDGDTTRKYNPDFPTIERIEWALQQLDSPGFPEGTKLYGETSGDLLDTGYRYNRMIGDPEENNIVYGADFDFHNLEIDAFTKITPGEFPEGAIDIPDLSEFEAGWENNMPLAEAYDQGLFAEYNRELTDQLQSSFGARIDFTGSDSTSMDGYTSDELQQTDTLLAAYIRNKYAVTDRLDFGLSFGMAQRAPSLIERYADGLYLGVMQSGYTRVIGDPNLETPTDTQVDFSFEWNNDENLVVGAKVFYAWVDDFITYSDDTVNDPVWPSARLLRYTNTSLATLSGFECNAKYDLTSHIRLTGGAHYVEGYDHAIDAFLPGMPPLGGTVGLLLHSESESIDRGILFETVMDARQDKVGEIQTFGDILTTMEEETPAYAVLNVFGYVDLKQYHLRLVLGVDNVFDAHYVNHMALRLSGPVDGGGQSPFGDVAVYSPGFTPYMGLNYSF